MFRWFRANVGSAQVERAQVDQSRPVIEGLEGRRLMSATLLDAGGLEAASAAGGGGGAGKVSMQDFHFVMKTLASQGKVSMQDFHFVMRAIASGDVETASHGSGGGAGKVSMQDFQSIGSATGGAGAGKVSMQDFHFVMKNNSASPR